MSDIARIAGCSPATVSMALRGVREIPERTRARIVSIAQELGYRPNPLVSALMCIRRRGSQAQPTTTTVVYLSSHDQPGHWQSKSFYREMYEGAGERLGELGFELQEFWLRKPGLTPARAREVLTARNIFAAIAGPLPDDHTELPIATSGLAVVGIGMSVQMPVIDRVANDHFQSAALAVQRCVDLGYRRIGLVLSEETARRLDFRWTGGYLLGTERSRSAMVSPLSTPLKSELPRALPSWLKAQRPDVVILGNAEETLLSLVPASVGLVSLGVDRKDGPMTGIFQNYRAIGRVTAQHVVAKLRTNSFDSVEVPQLHLIPGEWVAGATAPGPGQKRVTGKLAVS